MSAHTPGPWKLESGLGCKTIKGGKAGKHKQAQYTEIAYTVGLADEGVDQANGKLMAAAPDLLAACKAALELLDVIHDTSGKAGTQLAAAIAKAEGRA